MAGARILSHRESLASATAHLRNVKRFATILAAFVFAALLLLPHAAAAPAAVSRPGLSFEWTDQLAARFDGCAAHGDGVAAAFVVVRLDGSVQRMGFDEAWHRTHDRRAADDVWTVGQCRG